MNKIMLSSAIRLLMGGLAFYLAQRGFDQATIDTVTQSITALLGAGGVAGLALAWSANDKKSLLQPVNELPLSLPLHLPAVDATPDELQPVNKGFILGERSLKNLEGVHPDLVKVIEHAIITAPFDFTVIEGVRNEARQRALLTAGKSLTMNSLHRVQADGYGHAVDIGYIHDGILDGQYPVYEALNNHIQEVSTQLGVSVRWGGTFKHSNGKPFVDAGHFELA